MFAEIDSFRKVFFYCQLCMTSWRADFPFMVISSRQQTSTTSRSVVILKVKVYDFAAKVQSVFRPDLLVLLDLDLKSC